MTKEGRHSSLHGLEKGQQPAPDSRDEKENEEGMDEDCDDSSGQETDKEKEDEEEDSDSDSDVGGGGKGGGRGTVGGDGGGEGESAAAGGGASVVVDGAKRKKEREGGGKGKSVLFDWQVRFLVCLCTPDTAVLLYYCTVELLTFCCWWSFERGRGRRGEARLAEEETLFIYPTPLSINPTFNQPRLIPPPPDHPTLQHAYVPPIFRRLLR